MTAQSVILNQCRHCGKQMSSSSEQCNMTTPQGYHYVLCVCCRVNGFRFYDEQNDSQKKYRLNILMDRQWALTQPKIQIFIDGIAALDIPASDYQLHGKIGTKSQEFLNFPLIEGTHTVMFKTVAWGLFPRTTKLEIDLNQDATALVKLNKATGKIGVDISGNSLMV